MATKEDYVPSGGTITLTSGSTAFTTSGAELQIRGFRVGDEIYVTHVGKWLLIASIESDDAGTFAYACPDDCAVEDGPLYIRPQPDATRMDAAVRQFFDQIQQGLLLNFDKAGPLAARDQWDAQPQGFKFMRVDVLPFEMYVKVSDTSADWSGAGTATGPQGDPGSSDVVGTSTTSLAIGTGSKTWAIVEDDRGWGVGSRLRGSSNANAANFMGGVVTAYSANSLTVLVDTIGGSGTKADWTINLAGEPGADGAPGTDGTDADIAADTHAATSKATPVDADELPIVDSAASNVLKKLTWANLRTTIFAPGQIPFPATANLSSDANTLDDYEEGTWTPAFTFATPGDLAATYSTQTGRYVKIGSLVFINCVCFSSSFTYTTAASYFQLSGLPFTCNSNFVGAGAAQMNGWTKTGFGQLGLETAATTNKMYILASGSGVTMAELTVTNVTSGSTTRLYANGFYTTDQ